jgi:hypothetical protein
MKLEMKLLIKFIMFVLVAQTSKAQYYFKDIIASREAIDKEKIYRNQRVKSVELASMDANDQPEDGFACQQKVSGNFLQIMTYSKSKFTPESFQTTSYSENGLLKNTIDTSKSFYSVTEYQFDAQGRLTNITNTSTQTDNQIKDIEEHQWRYDQNGKPLQMIKIKNISDTTHIWFVLDEKGNVSEERSEHNHVPMQAIYYYYNDNHELTDIVRFNAAANRMLPDYIFSYNADHSLASMIIVPEGSSDYQRWVYRYDDKSLRIEEICFDKQKKVLGKIFYAYTYSK